MTLAALDFTSDRVWVVHGAPAQIPQIVPLDDSGAELPLVVSLIGRDLWAGRAALAQVRRAPHLVSREFLPRLGQPCEWHLGRHRLSPEAALRIALKRLRPPLLGCRVIVMSVPGYLHRDQVSLLARLAVEAGLPIVGAVPRTTAAVLAARAADAVPCVHVVVDVDEHAFSCYVAEETAEEIVLRHRCNLAGLSLRIWREQVIRCAAEECIRVCRRDPRESPEADQSVFDQLDAVFEQCSQNRPATLRVQAVEWFQEVTVRPERAAGACSVLARQAAEAIRRCLLLADASHKEPALWFTAEAARLPGLAAAVYAVSGEQIPVTMIASTALGRAIHALAGRIDSGELAPGYFESSVPLPWRVDDAASSHIAKGRLQRFSVGDGL